MKVALTTDIHFNPGDILKYGLKEYDLWIDLGDMLNIIPLGMGKWRTEAGERTIASIANACNRGIFIWKNHGGRKEWVQELFAHYPHITIVDDYELTSGDRLYKFMHGSEFTDWRIWSIGADDLTAFMTRIPCLRNLWYRICRWRGWMPSVYKGKKKTLVDKVLFRDPEKKYEWLIGEVHKKAIKKADDQATPCNLYYGHTHRYTKTVTDQGNEIYNLQNKQLMVLELEL